MEHRSRLPGFRFIPVVVLAAITLTGCRAASDVTVIKMGHGLDVSHPVHKAMVFMAEEVTEKSDGTMRVDVYPSEQLGNERQLVELLQIGSVGMTKVSAAVMESFSPLYRVLSVPFLFRDRAHAFEVLEGEIGRQILLDGERYWLRGLTFYDAGARSFYTKEHAISTPDDLVGMKIRTQESPSAMAMVKALGGSATPIAWGELYSALQQGVVDGAENNPPSFFLSRHYEVCKYYSLNEHTMVPDVVLISTKVWNDLTLRQQEWLQEAADASLQYQKELWRQAEEEALQAVQEAGVEVTRPDKDPFVEKVRPIYNDYRSEPEIHELILAIQDVQ